jgi:hypothetical protein
MSSTAQVRAISFFVFAAAIIAANASAAEVRVPLMSKPPLIDGKIDPAEWRVAAGFDGFFTGDTLQRRRVRAWIGADQQTIYIAIASQLPEKGPLQAGVARDSLKVAFDDAVEVFIDPTPAAANRVTYQFIVNSLGKGGYSIHTSGTPAEESNWTGKWRHAHGQHDGWWHFECAIPAASMKMAGPGRTTTEGAWQINLCRDWKPDWAWSSLAAGGYEKNGVRVVFTEQPAPVVQYAQEGDPTFPPSRGMLAIRNPSAQPLSLKASLVLTRNKMPALGREQTLSIPAGGEASLDYAIPENDSTTIYDLAARVASADGRTVFYDRAVKWTKAKSALHWVTEAAKAPPPLDFLFSYYPSKNRMRIQADINGLPRDARPKRVLAVVRKQADKAIVCSAEFPISGFRNGRQELTLTLPPLRGEYEIAVRAEGDGVPPGEQIKTFERHTFPWENGSLGTSKNVYPPFTPLRVSGRTLSAVLRTHELNDAGLLDQVACTSANTGVTRSILAAPMRYLVKTGSGEAAADTRPLRFASAADNEVVAEGELRAGNLRATFRDTWDYDGTVKVELTLHPAGGRELDGLTLEIPLQAEAATLIHANADRIRSPVAQKLPAGEGVVWDASKVACDEYIKNFCPYVYLGSAVRGLCWFADNDRGWGWNPQTPNIDVVRRGNQVVLRVHLVNQPTTIVQPRTICFGMLAAPVKPMLNVPGRTPNDWRYRFLRDNYHVLGTDINWLALGDCGSVYPAGGDLSLWQALKRGNTKPLNEQEVAKVIERGRRYFEPYGKDAVAVFVAHARCNCTAHGGAKMVFYYNRASCQLFDEFETFKDEWCFDDLRTIGKGTRRGEIWAVPTESYINYNLYWYKKSFELGGNRGVYWDNWFFASSFNTGATDAYRRDDGAIVPTAGIWGLRELCKRTFVMMNELGMTPITMPHMTSFSPLPMLAFATVQYDWEWKYSEGDVQDRFSREYLQLVSTGELAGTWPAPLPDQGALQDDPWTQRTFSAVRLVHELDGFGGFGSPWLKSHQENRKRLANAVLAMLDKPGLVVYKYWEDRPSPASSSRADVPTIVYSVPRKEALVAAVSYAQQGVPVTLNVDLKTLGLTPECVVSDVETGATLPWNDGKIAFPLKKHDIRLLRLVEGK